MNFKVLMFSSRDIPKAKFRFQGLVFRSCIKEILIYLQNFMCTYNTFTCINIFQSKTYIETNVEANSKTDTEAEMEAETKA